MEHVYNESANFMKSYVAHFEINEPSNLTEMVSVIGMEVMVSHAYLCYTWSDLLLGNFVLTSMC